MASLRLPGATSPFGVLNNQGSLLVSSSSANDDIHRYSYGGTSLGTFHNSTGLNFAEQMAYNSAGAVMTAGFSSNNVVTHDANGNIVSSFTASGARGVIQLGNGNIMWSNGSGAHIYDVGSGTSSLVYAGGGRYLDLVVVPEPATLTVAALGLLALIRRGRRQA